MVEYKILRVLIMSELEPEVNALAKQGYTLVSISTPSKGWGCFLVIMEKYDD